MNKLKAKKDMKILETSDIAEAYGLYLYRRVLRVWKENFIDESNGNVIPIERTEPVAEIGEKVEGDLSQKIDFLLQTGDVKSIVVCDQLREAVEDRAMMLYQAMVESHSKGTSVLFLAYDLKSATQILEDYCEQSFKGSYLIKSVKTFGRADVFIDRCPYKEMAIDFERAYERGDMSPENHVKWAMPSLYEFDEGLENVQVEGTRRFYYIEFDNLVHYRKDLDYDDFHDSYTAIIYTYSAERATSLVNAYTEAMDRDRDDGIRNLLTIEFSKPLNVSVFVPISFSKQVAGEL